MDYALAVQILQALDYLLYVEGGLRFTETSLRKFNAYFVSHLLEQALRAQLQQQIDILGIL